MRFHARAAFLIGALILGFGQAAAADRALLVGVSDYHDPQWSDLNGPGPDVRNMRDLLITEFGYAAEGILSLTDAQATRSGILEAISEWLIDGTHAGDRVFFYFSGHGADVAIPDGAGGVRLTSGLAPSDATSTIAHAAMEVGSLVLGAELGVLVRKMQDRAVTIVVDACHSGSLTRGANNEPAPPGIRTITPNGPIGLAQADITDALIVQSKIGNRLLDINAKGGEVMENVAVWSAATIAQSSFDTPGGGVFTNAFIAGISERRAAHSGDGRVTASGLLSHVRDVTGEFCDNHPRCTAGFTPELLAPHSYRAAVLAPYAPTSEIVPGQQPLPEITTPPVPDGQALAGLAEDVLTHTNDFALEAAILPGPQVPLGGTVQFRITAGEAGELLVADTGPDGKLRRIFPNAYSAAVGRIGRIGAAAPLTIPDQSYPFTFTATDPGPGTLLVLVAEPGTDFSALLDVAPAFEAAETPARALVAIAAELQAPVLDPDPGTDNRARRWAFVTVPYHVSP